MVVRYIKNTAVMVDEEFAELVSDKAAFINKRGYVICRTSKGLRKLHRLVTGAKRGRIVDHINLNKLDNTSANLRIVNSSDSNFNRRKFRNCSSQYRGVYWQKSNQRWGVKISLRRGKQTFIGYFDDELEAAKAYDAEAKKHNFGHRRNFE